MDKVAADTDAVEKALVDRGFNNAVVAHGEKVGIGVEVVERNPAQTGESLCGPLLLSGSGGVPGPVPARLGAAAGDVEQPAVGRAADELGVVSAGPWARVRQPERSPPGLGRGSWRRPRRLSPAP
ncbi:hypothetical protein [Streptomyces virginiae]|uniref:hypothetical protein n=1 Tax=Streptomyces virginiae TaxID=1961 RepID=UPI003662A458